MQARRRRPPRTPRDLALVHETGEDDVLDAVRSTKSRISPSHGPAPTISSVQRCCARTRRKASSSTSGCFFGTRRATLRITGPASALNAELRAKLRAGCGARRSCLAAKEVVVHAERHVKQPLLGHAVVTNHSRFLVPDEQPRRSRKQQPEEGLLRAPSSTRAARSGASVPRGSAIGLPARTCAPRIRCVAE